MRYPNPKNIIAAAERRLRDGTGRCFTDHGCVYYDYETKNRCVVGALLTIDQAKKLTKLSIGGWWPEGHGGIHSIVGEGHWSIEHAPLLRDLQLVHDGYENWDVVDQSRLSEEGEERLAKIKETYL